MWFESHLYGIETATGFACDVMQNGLNRTFMELKPRNETIVFAT